MWISGTALYLCYTRLADRPQQVRPVIAYPLFVGVTAMALVSIDSVLRRALQMLAKVEQNAGIELLSYKRNRSVSIVAAADDIFLVRERGYLDQDLTASGRELSKILKVMIKKEFPRSRKVRIFKFSHPGELERIRNTL